MQQYITAVAYMLILPFYATISLARARAALSFAGLSLGGRRRYLEGKLLLLLLGP